ncbi:MAG TPA: acetate--CoA ligase family protein, partial [Dehalococcoidales bacterium]|nr:acetate--CoA ligase family protein [Dehalococcoidales bacterium]
MLFRKIIDQAVAEKRTALTEAEAKTLLKEFGVPVVDEIVVKSLAELKKTADKCPYPAVVKGLGSKLTHKTEKGLVKLGLKNKAEVLAAAALIHDAAGPDLEGFLVQPLVEGKRELVAGLFFDPQFGPVIMFGLGGIFTEAIGDVAFRLAPLDDNEARVMMQEIKAQKILGNFRGEKSADTESIVKILTALSEISAAIPEISEIDINPLIISPDGRITAVDALIVLGKRELQLSKRPPIDVKRIQRFLTPESIAFVGATEEFTKWGHKMYSNVMAGKYQGNCYFVNVKGGEIAGKPVYKSVKDIPDPVDLAVVTIPAERILPLLDELQEKGIKSVVLITSGFRETGTEGKELEEKLATKAQEKGILILGPNTMGITNP